MRGVSPPIDIREIVRARCVEGIANDLIISIQDLGYPVGMGVSISHETAVIAANRIVDRIGLAAFRHLAATNAALEGESETAIG